MKYILCLWCVFCIYFTVEARDVIVNHYTTKNGLSHDMTYCSLCDSDGWVWFGTWHGLCRYDGVTFKTFNNSDALRVADIPPRKIQAMVEDRDKNIWVKTIDHRLYYFDKHHECFYSAFEELKKKYPVNSQVIKVQTDDSGRIVLLTKNKDVLLASVNEDGHVALEVVYSNQNIVPIQKNQENILSEDQNYFCWIGKDYKVIVRKKGRPLEKRPKDYFFQKIKGGEKVDFTAIYDDGEHFWLGGMQGDIWKVDYTSGNVDKYRVSAREGAVAKLLKHGDALYVYIEDQGLYEYNLRWGSSIKVALPSFSGRVTNISCDKYDKIWITVGRKSLVYFDPLNRTSKLFSFQEGSMHNSFTFRDGNEHGFFILTPAGQVYLFDRGNMTMENILAGRDEENLHFWNIQLDKEGVVWLASTDNGIVQLYVPKVQFKYYCPSLLMASSKARKGIKGMLETAKGDIWLGSRTGDVYVLDSLGNERRVYSDIGVVYHIMEDKSGNLWFSTKGRGLVKAEPDAGSVDGYRFTRYENNVYNSSSISGNDVYYTYQDSHGRIWVALFGGGLCLLDEIPSGVIFRHRYNTFTNYPVYGRFMEVRAMEEDNTGRIWVATTDGLMSFDGNFEHPEDIHFETFRVEDVEKGAFVGSDIYSLYKDSRQRIWASVFGGGLYCFKGFTKDGEPDFDIYAQDCGLPTDMVLSIGGEDENGNLWIATENCISCLDMHTNSFRNYDHHDGFLTNGVEEESSMHRRNGEVWFGCEDGILICKPREMVYHVPMIKANIVDFFVSNRNVRTFRDKPLITESITNTEKMVLEYNQNIFSIEYTALNYLNNDKINYKYILDGFDKEWHQNGRNRIASYISVPTGEYTFRVQAYDMAAPQHVSERSLKITILPPWWASKWAYVVYSIICILLLACIIRFIVFLIKVKNDIYIEQKLAELKIKFFTNVSHELRTPLTLIQGPIQELKEHEKLSNKGEEYVEMMNKSVNHMLQLVNQILDLRKIEKGKMRLSLSYIDMNEVGSSVYNEFKVMAGERRISLSLNLEAEPLYIWADRDRIETVIRNLFSNAFKFTPDGGAIYMNVIASPKRDHCYICVEDTGVGIPQNKLSDIFERFSQGSIQSKNGQVGTGIGLALAKEIVLLHHGEIKVASKLHEGTSFTIDLPTNKEHFNGDDVEFCLDDTTSENLVEGVNDESEEVLSGASDLPLLLFVEDNKDLCRMMQLQFEDTYRVAVASNGIEGLKKVHLFHPDIIVTDQMMPGMDGLEMLAQIRNDFTISHIPVIILTAKTDEAAKTKAIAMGANAYITKPFSREYLQARIEQLLSERRIFREHLWRTESSEEESSGFENYLEKKDKELLDKIHAVIDENIDNVDFNIDTIVSNIGLSRSAFFKKLKSLTGLAPVDLVKEIRLNKSVELLKNTDMTITEIAFAVGFRDSGYYTKCFRKKYMQTPREYIAEYRKKGDGDYKKDN